MSASASPLLARFGCMARAEEALLAWFRSAGFVRVYVPTLSPLASHADRLGDEVRTEYVTLVLDGEQVLRPELTTSVCRLVLDDPALVAGLPLRLAYAGQTFRVRRGSPLFPHERRQVGVELLGAPAGSAAAADAELLALLGGTAEVLGARGWRLALGHAELLVSVLVARGATRPEALLVRRDLHRMARHERRLAQGDALLADLLPRLLEARAKRSALDPASLPTALPARERAVFRGEWRRAGIPDAAIAALDSLPGAGGAFDDVKAWLRDEVGLQTVSGALDELARALELAAGRFPSAEHVALSIDPAASRDLAYYTGVLFDLHGPGAGAPLGGGGRYDRLASALGAPGGGWPAIGFALDLGAIADAMGLSEEAK